MIYLYSGTPGSGKSLHMARDILNRLKYRKEPVIANFEINPDTAGFSRFVYCPNDKMTPAFLYDFARDYWGSRKVVEDTILLCIDEAQLLFNSRAWQQNNRMDWVEFFSQHRHFGYKVVFVAQFDRMLDRQIRSLVEIEVKHRQLANFGWKGKLLALFCGGKVFAAVSYYYGLNERLQCEYTLPHKKYFRLYDSYNRFSQVSARRA